MESIILDRINQSFEQKSKKLDLSGLGISELPEILETCNHIRDLDLSNNCFTTLDISYLSNLSYLNVHNNNLTDLIYPDHLIRLDCSDNNLWILDDNATNLITLICDHNQLTSIPYFKDLRYLRCDHNQINHLNDMDVLYLNCSFNQLTQLPNLNMVQHLYCTHNLLTKLPDNMKLLRILFCHHNDIEYLPEDFLETGNIVFLIEDRDTKQTK